MSQSQTINLKPSSRVFLRAAVTAGQVHSRLQTMEIIIVICGSVVGRAIETEFEFCFCPILPAALSLSTVVLDRINYNYIFTEVRSVSVRRKVATGYLTYPQSISNR